MILIIDVSSSPSAHPQPTFSKSQLCGARCPWGPVQQTFLGHPRVPGTVRVPAPVLPLQRRLGHGTGQLEGERWLEGCLSRLRGVPTAARQDLEDFSLLPKVPKLSGVPEGVRVASSRIPPSRLEPKPAGPSAAHGVGRELALGVLRAAADSCARCAWVAIRGAGRHGARRIAEQQRGKALGPSFLFPAGNAWQATSPHPTSHLGPRETKGQGRGLA